MRFESFVNSERCKTFVRANNDAKAFESFVNSERCKTKVDRYFTDTSFESFVNSERCKTSNRKSDKIPCLRALLIQKDVKQSDRMHHILLV